MPSFQNLFQHGLKRKLDVYEVDDQKPMQESGRDTSGQDHGEQYWMVMWRMPQSKKHKTWDGDGVLVLNGYKGSVYDSEGKLLTAGKTQQNTAAPGDTFTVGNKSIEIDCAIARADYLSGACFGRTAMPIASATDSKPEHRSSTILAKKYVPLKPVTTNSPMSTTYCQHTGATVSSENNLKGGIDLHPVNLLQNSKENAEVPDHQTTHWAAHWRKPQQRKHKTWDGDAYLVHSGNKLILLSESGKLMGHISWNEGPPYAGRQVHIGGKVVELDERIPSSQVPNISGVLPSESYQDDEMDPENDVDGLLLRPNSARSVPITGAASSKPVSSTLLTTKFIAPTNFYSQPATQHKDKRPLHDPDNSDAVVMKSPTPQHEKRFNLKNRSVVPVVLDPILARHLRPHQREGVKFLYECVMGLRKHEGQGCILADEMGMGKTLQTITLIWTLLKQNPYAGGGPAVGKVLIVSPVSLVNNWKKEIYKWLGRDRIGVFVGDKDKAAIKVFLNSKIHHVLIIGYEKLRTVISELAYCTPPIGLVICDEGHRLKSANNKTSMMFDALRTPRRIILSGTPIQNDLSEFHAMADFCNPGLLDDYSTFRRLYENPILKSRAPDCSANERELGEARAAQLLSVANSFVLRREATILKKYLPPKYEYVVFVTPTNLQKSMFSKILHPNNLSSLIRGSTARSLALINMLTKISSSPILLQRALEKGKTKMQQDDSDGVAETALEQALKLIPERAQPEDVSLSGKLVALANLLRAIRKNTDEKCIIVSHYTSTLDVIQAFCKKKKYTYLRLDGQTPMAKRQEYVDIFNKSNQSQQFLFLLSAKAGGVGLNLIGASRLCLIDSDWNPSHDLQSMARIHRDGQKRPVFIYRLLTAGAIDEKIYQRQITKIGLSDSLIGTGADGGTKSKSDSFSHKDLRDLFTVYPHTACHTHDLLACPCSSQGDHTGFDPAPALEDKDMSDNDIDEPEPPQKGFTVASQIKSETYTKMDEAYKKKKRAELAALGKLTHINCLCRAGRDNIHDEILQQILYELPTSEVKSTSNQRNASILDAIDIAMDEYDRNVTNPLTVDDVPGGTICFLFEKGSSSSKTEHD